MVDFRGASNSGNLTFRFPELEVTSSQPSSMAGWMLQNVIFLGFLGFLGIEVGATT